MDCDTGPRVQSSSHSAAEAATALQGEAAAKVRPQSQQDLRCVALSEPGDTCSSSSSSHVQVHLRKAGSNGAEVKPKRRRHTASLAGARTHSCPPSPFANPDVQSQTVPPEPVKAGQLGHTAHPCSKPASTLVKTPRAGVLPSDAVSPRSRAASPFCPSSHTPPHQPHLARAGYNSPGLQSPRMLDPSSVVTGAPVRLVAGFPAHTPAALAYPHLQAGHYGAEAAAASAHYPYKLSVQGVTRKVGGGGRLGAPAGAAVVVTDMRPPSAGPHMAKKLVPAVSLDSRASSTAASVEAARRGCHVGWSWLANLFCPSRA